MYRILLINPFGIGDVLFTTPVIRAIKENYPESFVGYWCNQRVKPILENNPFLNKIFSLSRGDLKKIFKKSKSKGIKESLKLFSALRREKFNIALDFSLDHRYGLISKLAGIKKRIGFNYRNRGRFLTDKIDIDGYSTKHIVEYYLDTLRFLNISLPKEPKLETFIPEEKKDWAERFLKENNLNKDLLIGVAPGGGQSWGKQARFKQWSVMNFIKLIEKLIKDHKIKIFLFADENERELADYIENKVSNKNLINLGGKLSLLDYISILQYLKLLITNDSGNVHLAVAARIKTVSIFGPVDERVYGPYPLDSHIVIKKDFPCRPCYKNFRFLGCQYNLRCLEEISPEEVYNAIRQIINN